MIIKKSDNKNYVKFVVFDGALDVDSRRSVDSDCFEIDLPEITGQKLPKIGGYFPEIGGLVWPAVPLFMRGLALLHYHELPVSGHSVRA